MPAAPPAEPPVIALVTGVPGSGKTTLARRLAAALHLPLLSIDAVKETLFDALGVRDREWAMRVRGASLEVIRRLVPECPRGAVIDIWLDPDRDRGVARDALGSAVDGPVLEVLCSPPAELAVARYAARDRHPGHLAPDETTLTRIRRAAERIAPLGLGPALRLDTSTDVDVAEIVTWLRAEARRRSCLYSLGSVRPRGGAVATTPRISLSAVTLDAPDVGALAAFYRDLLGWEVSTEEPDWVTLRPAGGGTGISIQKEDAYVRPSWPARPGDQHMMVHLDIEVADLDTAGAAASAAGATLADYQPQPNVRVYLDPAGHPFCLFLPE